MFSGPMRRAPLFLAVLALGCSKKPLESAPALLSEVKEKLSGRDAKLTSYHLAGLTRQGAEEAAFEFFYRQPYRMRGVLTRPARRTFSWDGQRLYELAEAEKRFTTFENKLPPERSLFALTRLFSPFAPEGYRAPLIPREAKARRTTHPRAPEAVEVTVETADESGALLTLSYLFRWPSLDFLAKRVSGMEIRVEEEHCEERLKLCFPKKLAQWQGSERVATTELSTIELNPPLPAESFTLSAPAGYESRSQELVPR